MPRPTREVRELRDALAVCRKHLTEQGHVVFGLRKDIEGACRNSKDLEATIIALRHEANEDDQHIKELEAKFEALSMKHNAVCVMWANTMAQFDNCEIGTRPL